MQTLTSSLALLFALASFLSCTSASTFGSCALVRCAFPNVCEETPLGPRCVRPRATCAAILCMVGTRCVEGPNGARCESTGPSCRSVRCGAGRICKETPSGPKCVQRRLCRCARPKRGGSVCCRGGRGLGTRKVDSRCACSCSGGSVVQGSKCIGCATIDCQDGFRCVEKPRPRCVPIIGGGGGGCACTLEFRPVCCMGRDGRTSTKGNRCACTGCNSGGIVMSEGECPKIEDENGCGCPAPRGFGIVCCKKNGERFFSKSTCTCECGGGQAVSGDFCTGMFGDIGRVIA